MATSNKWLMSSFAYYLDFFTVPLFVFLIFCIAPFHPGQALAGLLAWSLVEYSAHRFLFHSLYRREHWTHHIDVLAYIGISGWKTNSVNAVLLLLAWLTGLTSVFAGLLIGYFCYISLHYVLHRPQHWAYRFIPGLVANHNLHHRKGIEKNFGVTSPLWDHVMRTYVRTEVTDTVEEDYMA
ncbi:sterol desaturase family protein [Pseudomonas sp. CCI3.2]|uniref:sterol desaturase family protein n=1 Tax=unclassified Pseudomonas TaxID=196821 RepID=UPI002AC9B7B8|nr:MULTISPECIES: sterol desaturase family protein [unclassified Pseudomonas]MEB0079765.1 sterol desaturase family protein [Pseudomonas sp. MH10out]MEB0092543.1 sterol desaturase family protein [Pseudomonas sp. CCI4.2]MEB0104541.1 sterol desaturase family protein [Pseudomonas sp. CCI3.2]MEB0122199.1 sterol desaturase family protein [Pseudomonas sp. CCI1.2]MEB0130216.1 sterol desaturase family protein [Pseudomonas sp. CCI2.4]